jgi:hypothetical protein
VLDLFIHLAYASGRLAGGPEFWPWAGVDIGLAALPVALGIIVFARSAGSSTARVAAAAVSMGALACVGIFLAIFGY